MTPPEPTPPITPHVPVRLLPVPETPAGPTPQLPGPQASDAVSIAEAVLSDLAPSIKGCWETLTELQSMGRALSGAAASVGGAERQEAPRLEKPASAPVEAASREKPSEGSQQLWLQMLLTLGMVVLMPLLAALALALVLRRSSLRFRVELAGSQTGPVVVSASRVDAAAFVPVETETPSSQETPLRLTETVEGPSVDPELFRLEQKEPEPTGEQFDLGPSYEEEKRAKEEALHQQEMAVLQQIFEDNRKLLEEIEESSAEGPAQEGSPELPS
jgi:hypothetical protein